MSRTDELERDRQIAELQGLLRGSAAAPTREDDAYSPQEEDPDEAVDVRVLDGFGDGYQAPKAAWRARLIAQRSSLVVFVTIAVLAAAATALVTWFLRPVATAVPAAELTISDAGDERDEHARPAVTAEPDVPAQPEVIVVAVVGQVAEPGLVTLPDGARVSDAIDAAGGALPGTDLSTINIARRLSDGEQVAVGVPPAPDAQPPGQPSSGAASSTTKVNLNSAGVGELDALPGVGPVIAQRIVDFREQNGPFGSVAELANVSGIGPAMMAKLADLVTV